MGEESPNRGSTPAGAVFVSYASEDADAEDADPSFHLMGRALVYYARHRRADADTALASLTADSAERHAYRIAQVLAYRGDRDAAFRWLDRAYAQTDSELQYIKGEPLLRNLAGDRRYQAFLRKMNLPE